MARRLRRAPGTAREQTARDHAEDDERKQRERANEDAPGLSSPATPRHAAGLRLHRDPVALRQIVQYRQVRVLELFEVVPVGRGHVTVRALVGQDRAQVLASI
jgi:hypothetical protein